MSHTPIVKFEPSPADSLVDSFSSNPNAQYSSLFSEDQVLTPQSFDDDSMFGDDMHSPSTPAKDDAKPVKKRKSWGQQLPEPKTNLPPRKRAKTEDEKEQRRVERVLRNRRAAQSSRERKRQEVEALEAEKMAIEQRNRDLEARLAEAEANNLRLLQQLEQATNGNMRVFQGTPPASSPVVEQLRAVTPVTFSQDLFGSREEHQSSISTQSLPESRTVNPASLSPSLRPQAAPSNASASDMTQHPAAMLCDLPCQSEAQRPWISSPTPTPTLAVIFLLSMISAATSTLLSPMSQITTSLATGAYLPTTTSILTLIIWMVTTTASLTTSSSTTSYTNTTTSRHSRRSVRMSLLRRLLSCNPHLARPLMDATMVAMRLASEQPLVHACSSSVVAGQSAGAQKSPSIEALMTLLWAIQSISREDLIKEPSKLDVATEVRQACDELEELFRPRKMPRSASTGRIADGLGLKSLEAIRRARS